MASANTNTDANVQYIKDHGIVQLMESLTSSLLASKPADPVQFLLDTLKQRSQRKLHVALIEDKCIRGGAQIWLVETARRLLAAGHTCVAIAPAESFVAQECATLGTEVVTYADKGIAAQLPEMKKKWTEALSKAHVAVVLVRAEREGFQNVRFAGECIREGNLKTYLIAKTGTTDSDYKTEYYIPLPPERCSVVTISEDTRQFIIKHYNVPPHQIRTIYNGTDISRFQPLSAEQTEEAKRRYPVPEGAGPIFGIIGSLEQRKGHLVLFEAVAQVVREGSLPNIHVLVVGEGPDDQMLQQKRVEMGLEKHITIFPFTKQPEYVFGRIDAVALPSFVEGLPNVLLEGYGLGVPAVASRIAGIPEIVIDGVTGYTVPAGDAAALAKGMVELTKDKEKAKALGQKGRTMVFAEHDKLRQFEKIVQYIIQSAGN